MVVQIIQQSLMETGNTISGEFKSSAIIGGVDIDAYRSQTTPMKGLDVNTNTTHGQRAFTYA